MKERLIIRYSSCFKRQVVEEFEKGRFASIYEANAHYGIKGATTIRQWLRRYGHKHLCAKVVRVEKPDEKEQIRQLKKQVRQLKEALGHTQAEKILGEEFLKMACEELGQDVEQFKKKGGMAPLAQPTKEAH